MKSLIPIRLIALVVLAISFSTNFVSVQAQANMQPLKTAIDEYTIVNSHKMHYQKGGEGSATVIFESGLGDGLNPWGNIFPEVVKFSKAVCFDRLGYGSSEPTKDARTLKQMAAELHSMLQQANIEPPYILVGHSLGGGIIRAFAYLYKDETAGLVFIDPFNEFETDGMPKEVLQHEMALADSMFKSAPAHIYAEFKDSKQELLTGFPEINSFGDLPDIPMVMLVAGKDRPQNWEKNLVKLFETKMYALSETRLIILPQSPHYIQNYDPAVVIESIRRIVSSTSKKSVENSQ